MATTEPRFTTTDAGVPVESDEHSPLDDDMVADHLHQVRHERQALFDSDLGRHAPRCRELGLKEEAAYESNRAKHI